MKICQQEHSIVYRKFARHLKKVQVAIKKADTKTKYLVMIHKGDMIGVVGWQKISDTHIRYKTDYVNPFFRRRYIYSDLWKKRDKALPEGIKTLSAYCTKLSLPKYLKEGFKAHSTNKLGITYVKKEL